MMDEKQEYREISPHSFPDSERNAEDIKNMRTDICNLRRETRETRADVRAVFGEIRHLKSNHLEHIQGSLDEVSNNQIILWDKMKDLEQTHATDEELNAQDHEWIKKLLWWVLGLLAGSSILVPVVNHFW